MVTIKDVARKAGVSIATVSRVMNGVSNVGAENRESVLRAIEELEYQPNAVAQAMKKKTFCTIGVIMPDFSTPFFEKIIMKIEAAYRGNGNLVLFVNTYDDPKIERKGIEFMVERQTDVLLISSTGENEDYLARLMDKDMPIVFLDRRSKTHKFPSIYIDKRAGMYQAMEYLAQMNHERVALISGPRQLATNYDRYEGASRFLYDNEKSPNNIQYYFDSFTEEYGYSTTEKLLKSENRPSAIVVGSAVLATGVITCCRDNGVRLPEDISLISFGDLAQGKLIDPRLTYIDDGHKEIAERLLCMIEQALNKELTCEEVVLQPKLIINNSVQKLKTQI